VELVSTSRPRLVFGFKFISPLLIEMLTLVIMQIWLLKGQFCSGPIRPKFDILFLFISELVPSEPVSIFGAVQSGTMEKVRFLI